mmetsp:Transcript_2464/g.7197  ORF Transcript_2464/g.7197 Transcript_2464/m.7197 type:complete len:283 (-) Transcript_2464:2931-3779(-)
MRTQLGLSAIFLSAAVATAEQEQHADNRRLRGLAGSNECGYVPTSCCCIDGRTTCIDAICDQHGQGSNVNVANKSDGGPCGGGAYYTVRARGINRIVCKNEGEEVDIDPSLLVAGGQADEELIDTPAPEDTKPDGPAKCSIDNWSLEGRGDNHTCTSNDDCKYGCCSTGQVEGRCISPFINPAFSTFLGCMPEFSECESNRVGINSPYTDDDGEIETEYVIGIDSCEPKNPAAAGVTKCCSSSSDCAGFGEECCDRVRLQCVPKLGSDYIINQLQCLGEGVN